MKKTILFLALIVATACKKEDPTPPTTVNPAPAPTTNYVRVGSQYYTVDENLQSVYFASADTTMMQGSDSTQTYVGISFPGNAIGTFHATSHSIVMYSPLIVLNGTDWYRYPNLTINVTRYGAVGDTVECDFSGTMKKQTDTTVVINVSGKLRTVRQQNQ